MKNAGALGRRACNARLVGRTLSGQGVAMRMLWLHLCCPNRPASRTNPKCPRCRLTQAGQEIVKNRMGEEMIRG
jgi:hypothetical protein